MASEEKGDDIMKTIVIWDTCCESNIQFFILDGDYSHLNGLYLNTSPDDKEMEAALDELNELVYGEPDGEYPIVQMLIEFPPMSADENYKVIVAGFLP